MQVGELLQTAPVAPVKAFSIAQQEGHGHRPRALPHQVDANGLGHAFGQQAEELAG
ncbi:hypothetical protein D3C78_1909610 [compost metagenome]